MAGAKLKLGVIGCGNIAGPYARSFKVYPDVLELVAAADMLPGRADAFVKEHGGRACKTIDELIADPAVNTVVNLTPFSEHYGVSKKAILAGKHVFSEKPLGVAYAEAQEIVKLAKEKGVRVACAPITFMGEAQQTAAKLIRAGKLGTVRVIYAEVNHGRIEHWHPAPELFFKAGPMYDVGVYPTALTTAFFGPVRKVSMYGKVLLGDRKNKDGKPFPVPTPDYFAGTFELESGVLLRLTANFYIQSSNTRQGEGMEFHGDQGDLHMENWFGFASPLSFAEHDKKFAPVEPVRKPAYADAVEWSRVLKEMSDAIGENRPHRASAEHAAHVVEVICAVTKSAAQGGAPVAVTSSFDPPAPMPWAV
ncbi:MAG: Gfo/Idh/MocA family oxidoreductase [bacterium]